tara:strand:- start:1108 stop:2232 length:1125 start_codon:yes stop_codon:yes gene_type:complete
MIILKSQLKQIIREEAYNLFLEEHKESISLLSEGLITEKEYWKRTKDWAKRKGIPWATAAAIAAGSLAGPSSAMAGTPAEPAAQVQVMQVTQASFLDAFYKAYPAAQDPSKSSKAKSVLAALTVEVKGNIALAYLSEQRKESFVKFIQSMPRFENQTREQILQKFDVLKPEILKIIQSVPVEVIYEGEQTERMYRSFTPGATQSGGQVAAAYDEESNKIVVNPYEYMSGGQLDKTALGNSVREEIYHAIDHNLSTTTIPMSRLQHQAATAQDIFLSQETTGLSQSRYDYLTSNHEFYAKMLRLKDIVAEKHPEQITNGRINSDFLLKLMDGIETLGDPSVIEVLQVLDPSKINKVSKYFDMVAQAETQKTSQAT